MKSTKTIPTLSRSEEIELRNQITIAESAEPLFELAERMRIAIEKSKALLLES